MPSPLRRPGRSRRGANAIELALLMTVFLAILGGIFDYGWYFFLRSAAITAAREGCRQGAVLPKDNVPDPETRATTVMTNLLANYGLNCGGDDCSTATQYVDSAPVEQLQCDVAVTYESFTGINIMPGNIQITSTSLLEEQEF